MCDHVGPMNVVSTDTVCLCEVWMCVFVCVCVTIFILCLCECTCGRLNSSPQRYRILVPGNCECPLICQRGLCRCA